MPLISRFEFRLKYWEGNSQKSTSFVCHLRRYLVSVPPRITASTSMVLRLSTIGYPPIIYIVIFLSLGALTGRISAEGQALPSAFISGSPSEMRMSAVVPSTLEIGQMKTGVYTYGAFDLESLTTKVSLSEKSKPCMYSVLIRGDDLREISSAGASFRFWTVYHYHQEITISLAFVYCIYMTVWSEPEVTFSKYETMRCVCIKEGVTHHAIINLQSCIDRLTPSLMILPS